MPANPPFSMSRRGLLRAGGATVSLAALIAACGSDDAAPGRVGNAPPVTDPPEAEVTPAVLLRTAASLEHTAIEVYAQLGALDAFDADATALVERLVADHTANAETLAGLTTDAGGTPYDCPNPWYMERSVEPIMSRLVGDEDAGLPASDDLTRDAMAVVHAFESVLASTYQQMVAALTEPELRREMLLLGSQASRHAAAVAIHVTGSPAAYFSPELLGEELEDDGSGLVPIFAVSTQFASLGPVELIVGPQNEAGTRFTTNLQTPAANSYVYDDLSCEA